MARCRQGKPVRAFPEGSIPLLDVGGDARECGIMLGYAWRASLAETARSRAPDSRPWWKGRQYRKLIDRYAPYLPDLFRGMAKGAGVGEDLVGSRALPETGSACTSFAIAPGVTLDGIPISGQTKDTSDKRVCQYQVLRMKVKGGPSALTLTYAGWIFGHGFVTAGCSIFRNSLFAGDCAGRLSYAMWGILALHCPTAQEAAELATRYGVACEGAHCTVADSKGGIVGIEMGAGGIHVLKPNKGVYTHGNHVASGPKLKRHETYSEEDRRDSEHRQSRLYERLAAERGRLTAQLAYVAMTDHDGFPYSICRHRGESLNTTATVIVEPTRGLLHATRSAPCQNWPKTYSL